MRRALCVGVDNYPFGSLGGCVSDAERLAAALSRHDDNSVNFEPYVITAPLGGRTDVLTRSVLREAINALLKHPADLALFSFSGHGTENNLGGYLVTQDATSYDEGVAMADIVKLANDSKVGEVVILLDCCHSGHMGNVPVVDNSRILLREGISILTASREAQISVEVGGGGLFTSLVVDALQGGAADLLGDVTAPGIYGYVEGALGAWDQRPLFKGHVAKLTPLRKCHPAVELSIIRELPSLFPVPAEDIALSPEFEPSCEARDADKASRFCKLQALSRVHLVVPVGAIHMYDAAMESKACRLTASGRYYWRLANSNRI